MSADARGAQTGAIAPQRVEGVLPIAHYGALGEGRSVALSGLDGGLDWWCAPNMDSPPLFDRLLDGPEGGHFTLAPEGAFTARRRYLPDSNVLVTTFTTDTGEATLTESLNSGNAGRLPWSELARRIDGVRGQVRFGLEMKLGMRARNANPYHSRIGPHTVFHVERLLGLMIHHDRLDIAWSDAGACGTVEVSAGERITVALVVGEEEPLVAPTIEEIDGRIDLTDREWRDWARNVSFDGDQREAFVRSALALKLLLYSPSGAIAAAATTSLPERIGGHKNYDYRYAWIRDAGYTIQAFLAAGLEAESKAAFTWLLRQLRRHGSRVVFTLDGALVPDVSELRAPGYRGSQPVVRGNLAGAQHQHGIYGDIFETAYCFVDCGNILDPASAELLSHIADECADRWRLPDSGMWELQELQDYTMSKVSCWQALARAVELADQGQLPTTCRDRWGRERDRIKDWIETHCWSEDLQAFAMYPGSDKLDAAIALAARFGFDGPERLKLTMAALDRELGAGDFHYRYSGMDQEEGCFLACSFWIAESYARLGDPQEARRRLERLGQALTPCNGVMSEMIDPGTGALLGNTPQGLSHLAHVMALSTLAEIEGRG
ncbi:glycoside hydrolase family 15 protein [Pseudoxanthomonas winnipegensis]|uniref:Glycoside hydrolase family 15 protein n=1 Tax=Pseudoxanthomonas winnipegensis TaxID=2480810 RepID=A0A4Q8LSB8_9GAMM|nr:glycoside hydrolase family 15 protein [Pseudoxanthomonas winnipegensis]RZZ88351.1 glycoside hydrolase family 15 protein [Pseudoxanthomonas winnipegensis]TAA34637.1 glycoside hydrolase family 15 protein [Pseudoxanthomonas winnipegensis]